MLETPRPIPTRLDSRQPASGLLLALGLEGQAIPREAGPWVNTSLPGEGAQHGDAAPGERKRLRWSCGLRLCWGGSGHVFLARPRNKFLFQTVISLSLSPLELQNLRQITRVIFLLLFPLSPSLAGTARWPQLQEITALLGGSSPGSASPPRSSPASLPWGDRRVWGWPVASGTRNWS